MVGQRVGMDRQEQLGPEGARPDHPLAQRYEMVATARQQRPIAAAGVEQARQFARRRQGDRLFVEPVRADGAGIDAAMSRIEGNEPRLRPLPRAGRTASRLGRAETAVSDLQRQLADPELYQDNERVKVLVAAYDDAKDRAASLMDQWMEAQGALDRANARFA